jgi:hypothetical protein
MPRSHGEQARATPRGHAEECARGKGRVLTAQTTGLLAHTFDAEDGIGLPDGELQHPSRRGRTTLLALDANRQGHPQVEERGVRDAPRGDVSPWSPRRVRAPCRRR